MAAASVVAFSTLFLSSNISFANSNLNLNQLLPIRKHSKTPKLNRNDFRCIVKCLTNIEDFNRSDFPADFMFGASTSAIQIESSPRDGGRGESTMDGSLGNGSGAKSLQKYNEDVLCLGNMGMDVYRFSIAWPRLFPSGTVSKENLNQEGLDYYLNLFKLLKLNGITPIVTLFHFDLPKKLEDEYGGTSSLKFVDDFKAYADFCFKTFGTYVKHWVTVNEPQIWSAYMYPSAGSTPQINGTDPYKRGYTLLNAHAQAVQLYRKKYKRSQGGKIGMSLNAEWFLPYSSYRRDGAAAVRAWDFMAGWFLDPLVEGDYPFTMKKIVGDRLPQFTDEQKEALKGSFDFIGINYYMSHYAKAEEYDPTQKPTYITDPHYSPQEMDASGKVLGPKAEGNDTLIVYPQGLNDVLLYLKNHYGNPLVYITENGYPKLRKSGDEDFSHGLNDDDRIDYIKNHLKSVLQAINEGANVGAYCVWTLLDCMEFKADDPYSVRFGLNFTVFDSDNSRIPKKSAAWLKAFLATPSVPTPPPASKVEDESPQKIELLTNGVM